MTNQTDERNLNLVTNVRVRVVFGEGRSEEFDFADMVQGRSGATPDTVSDEDMITLAATHLDLQVSDFEGMVCSRPATSNILISPKPVFGK